MKRLTRAVSVAAGVALGLGVLAACGGGDDDGDVIGAKDDDCTPAHEFETVSEGFLTVVPYEFMPYASVEGDKLIGVDGEVVTEIAKRECLQIKIMQLPAASALESVATGRSDLVMGGIELVWNLLRR